MSDTVTMTLTEFLLARIAEDEALARAVQAETLEPGAPIGTGDDPWPSERAFAEYVTPARVLAECEAKRRIVEAAEDYTSEFENESWRTEDQMTAGRVAGRARSWQDDTLRYLAMPYADHPDFDEAWKS